MIDVEELIAFLREALREDEALAQKPVSEHHEPERWGITYRMPGGWDLICREGSATPVGSVEPGFAHHIVRWDPARVLAEVEAKRARIDLLASLAAGNLPADWPTTGALPLVRELADMARTLLRLDAQPLADRPGFKPEWRLT